jgi:hypothetical protein
VEEKRWKRRDGREEVEVEREKERKERDRERENKKTPLRLSKQT